MNTAIVSGATGFIGAALTNHLVENGIKVVALGRRGWNDVKGKYKRPDLIQYVNIAMKDIEELSKALGRHSVTLGSSGATVFYHLAWSGLDSLSDLNVEAQFENVWQTVAAYEVAASIGCTKFVHVGTMEEAFTKRYLTLDHNEDQQFNRHVVYALAKIMAKKALMAKAGSCCTELIVCYNSHVMGPNDDKDSFLQVTLKKMAAGEDLVLSSGEQYFDVISSSDCARALKSVGAFGVKNREYWIGSGSPRKLKEYVEEMAEILRYPSKLSFGSLPYNDISLRPEDFSTRTLEQDTNFSPLMRFKDTVLELHQHFCAEQ